MIMVLRQTLFPLPLMGFQHHRLKDGQDELLRREHGGVASLINHLLGHRGDEEELAVDERDLVVGAGGPAEHLAEGQASLLRGGNSLLSGHSPTAARCAPGWWRRWRRGGSPGVSGPWQWTALLLSLKRPPSVGVNMAERRRRRRRLSSRRTGLPLYRRAAADVHGPSARSNADAVRRRPAGLSSA